MVAAGQQSEALSTSVRLCLGWGVVDLTAIPAERRFGGDDNEYRRVLKQVREGGWGFLIGNGDPLGMVTVAKLEVAHGALS